MGLSHEATASTPASVTNNRYLGLRFHCSESREEEVRLSWGASQNPNNVVREGHRCRMPALLCPSYDLGQAFLSSLGPSFSRKREGKAGPHAQRP